MTMADSDKGWEENHRLEQWHSVTRGRMGAILDKVLSGGSLRSPCLSRDQNE